MRMMRILLRLVLVGLLMAAAGSLAIYGSWKLLHPFLLQRDQRTEIVQLEQRVARLKREHAGLKEAVRRLATPAGRAEELRRLGYLKPKERFIRFLQGEPHQPPAAQIPQEPAPAGVKNRIRAWLERRLGPTPGG